MFSSAIFGASGIFTVIKFRLNLEPLPSGSFADQTDDDLVADERTTAPVLGNMAESATVNLIPLADAWWEMTHVNRHLQLIYEILQSDLPRSATAAVATTTVGMRMVRMPYSLPPPTNSSSGELSGVVIGAHADQTLVVREVIHVVGNRLAQFLVQEVIYANLFKCSVRLLFSSTVLKVRGQLLLFRIHRDHRLPALLKLFDRAIDVLKLSVAIGVQAAFLRFAIALQTLTSGLHQSSQCTCADGMPLFHELTRERVGALTSPTQRRLGIATTYRIDQQFQSCRQFRIGNRLPSSVFRLRPPLSQRNHWDNAA